MAGPAIQIVNSGGNSDIPFGSVANGTSLLFHLPIQNYGSTDLVITAIALTGTNASDFVRVATLPLTIPAGTTDESVTLEFTPTAARGTFEQATLTITSNAVAGVHVYAANGTCVHQGTSTNTNSTTGTISGNASQTNPGTNGPTYSAVAAFPSLAVSGKQVTLSADIVNSSYQIFLTGSIDWAVEVSVNGGSTWTLIWLEGQTASGPVADFNTTISYAFALGAIIDLNQLQVRLWAQADNVDSGTVFVQGDLTNMVASTLDSGDRYLRLVQTSGAGNPIAPEAFYGNISLGSTNLSNLFTLTNPSQSPVTVTLTPDTGVGYSLDSLTGGLTLLALSASSITFKLQVIPATGGFQDDLAALAIGLTVPTETLDLEAFFTSTSFTPVFTLVGNVEETVMALSTGGTPSAKYFDPGGLLNDGVVALSRQYYVDQPHLNKILNRIWLLFERYAAFTLTCSVSVVNPKNQPVPTPANVSSTATDGLLDIGCFDLQITGSCINVQWTMPVNTGQFSLVGFLMKLDEIGEVIENT